MKRSNKMLLNCKEPWVSSNEERNWDHKFSIKLKIMTLKSREWVLRQLTLTGSSLVITPSNSSCYLPTKPEVKYTSRSQWEFSSVLFGTSISLRLSRKYSCHTVFTWQLSCTWRAIIWESFWRSLIMTTLRTLPLREFKSWSFQYSVSSCYFSSVQLNFIKPSRALWITWWTTGTISILDLLFSTSCLLWCLM